MKITGTMYDDIRLIADNSDNPLNVSVFDLLLPDLIDRTACSEEDGQKKQLHQNLDTILTCVLFLHV